jgi:hypothetical protein
MAVLMIDDGLGDDWVHYFWMVMKRFPATRHDSERHGTKTNDEHVQNFNCARL